MARPTRKTSGYAGEMAGTALSVAVNGHRDGRINYPGALVLPNLPLHGTVRAVCLHPLRDVCDGNWRGDCGDKSQKYRAEADWLHRGVYGSIMGIKFSIKLNGIHHAVHNADPDSLFGVQGCSTDPTFPFNLPLAEWAPEWFKPTGDCGYDAPIVPDGVTLSSVQQWFVDLYQQSEGWYLLPPWHFMNMAQACMLAFGLCLILLLVMSGAWALKLARGK